MRLKKLKLHGFKSFCDESSFEFRENGITLIVGPNGCGKSNVLDAIRWVLGEQSARYLRGSAMGDVIFNGSDSRKPVGRSEVTIHFDNSDGNSLEKYRDLSEISVTRRLYRSGESEYLINRVPCRLMDVRELLMDTGAAGRSYSIVEQGRVEEFILASPAERRNFFEEAAGIVRFKTHRIAAERKLEQTRVNRLRAQDLQSELERQEAALRDQVEKARAYLRLREEVNSLQFTVARAHYAKSARQCRELESEQEKLKIERTTEETALEALQTRLEAATLEGAATEGRLREQRQAENRVQEEIHESETALALEKQKLENSLRWNEQLRKTHEETRLQSTEVAEKAESLRVEAQTLAAREEALRAEIGEVEGRFSHSEEERRAAEEELQALRERLLECHTQITGLANQRKFLAERLTENEVRRGALKGQVEESSREREQVRQALTEEREKVDGLRQGLVEREGRIAGLEQEIAGSEEEQSEIRHRGEEARRALLACTSRLESLQEIESGREGFAEAVRAVLTWLEETPAARDEFQVMGPLADFIQVEPAVLEWAGGHLAPFLEYLVVRQASTLPAFKERLEAEGLGGVKVVALDAYPEAGPATAGGSTLADQVRLPTEFDALRLGLFAPVGLHAEGPLPHPLPEPLGSEWLARDGGFHIDPKRVVAMGSAAADPAGILQRRAEISSLEGRAGDLEKSRAAVATQADALDGQLAELRDALEEEEAGRARERLELNRLEAGLSHREKETARLTELAESLRTTLANLEGESARAAEQQTELEAEAGKWSAGREGLEKEGEAARRRIEEISSQAAGIAEELTERKVEHGKLLSQLEHHRARVAALEEEAAGQEGRLATVEKELAFHDTQQHSATETIARLSELLRELQERLARQREEIRTTAQQFEEREVQEKALTGQAGQKREALALQVARLHEVELSLATERSRMEQWVERLGRPPEEPGEEEEAGEEEDVDEAAQARRLASGQEQLREMEGVNLAAPEEYDTLMERLGFLRRESADLDSAIGDLEESIRRMNQESLRRFKETFDQVNEKFQEVFPLMFNGGEGRLVMTDSEDPLLAGVDVVAQPPGKRLQGLNLLSGGEKALTAIALIFSFFLIKPSPFCLLDEVDAPLDDANIGRFSQLVRNMTDKSQFIIITHNKRTMEVGDKLYGVTMEEPGVSKIVSVNLSG